MARSINKCELMGNLATDPEVRYTAEPKAVATFRLVTDSPVKSDGEWTTEPEYHNIVAFGRTAEICKEYLHKGSRVIIEGRLKTRSWDDKDSGKKQYRTEIIVNDDGLYLLDKGKGQKDTAEKASIATAQQ